MRVVVRVLLVAAALAGAAVGVWTVRSGWSWVSAALDLLAGWSLLAAGGWAMQVTGGCRALLGLSGVCWFLATPQVVGGTVGHDAALLGAVWLAPLATALLGSPEAVPARRFQRAVAATTWVRALPAVAGIGWLTAATAGCLAAAALLDARRYGVMVPRVAAAVVGVVLGVAGVLEAVAGRGSALEPLLAVSVAGCGIAMLAVRPARAATDSGFAGLVVELGQTRDALSLERRLAHAVGDPRLRLLYQVAALEHDRTTLDDPQLRQAVLTVSRLAVRRLMCASEAAQQSLDLADSRRRLSQAETRCGSSSRAMWPMALAGS